MTKETADRVMNKLEIANRNLREVVDIFLQESEWVYVHMVAGAASALEEVAQRMSKRF